jgi:hypothetical protein
MFGSCERLTRKWFAVLSLVFFLTACTEKTQSYYPFDVGYRWEYKAILTTMDSTANQKYIFQNYPEKIINEQKVFVQKSLTGSEYIYRDDESGVYQLGFIAGHDVDQTFISDKHYLFQKPLHVGKEWRDIITTRALANGGPRGVVIVEDVPVKVVLEAVDDKVKVAAGSFKNCLRIVQSGEITIPVGKYQYIQKTKITVKNTAWYAPGVGLVKSIRIEDTESRLLDHGEYQVELASFSSK